MKLQVPSRRQTVNRSVANQFSPKKTGISYAAPGAKTGGAVVQRLIVRIRDLKEIAGSKVGIVKPVIKDSSERLKHDMQSEKYKEDIGIGNLEDLGRQLEQNEPLYVVAHGSEPRLPSFLSDGQPKMGGKDAETIAGLLKDLFPPGYGGLIYMNGCNTATRLNYGKGTSFIELFAAALSAIRPDITFRVRGNIGNASTGQEGEEYIQIRGQDLEVARALGWPIIEQNDNQNREPKYYLASPFGTAFCNHEGAYNDLGLSEKVLEIAEEKQRIIELLREQRRNNGPLLHPTMNSEEQDRAWNDML